MMDPGSAYDTCRASLVRCLATVAAHCPELPANDPPLHRLRNLVQVLAAAPEAPAGLPAEGLSLTQAVAMLAATQNLLETLGEAGAAGRVNGEMHQELRDTVAASSDRLSKALRQKRAGRVRGLYVIIDPQVTGGRDPAEIATAAVRGGARMLQLRDKLRDKGDTLPLATQLQELCQASDVDLIINDHADLAAIIGCAGLHLGQTDLPVAQARGVLSPQQVVGRSNHEIDELVQSEEMGADHLAFGAIYPTSTKGVGRPPQGVARLRQAREATQAPLVAIGGINAENAAHVVEAGADAICVAAAVGQAAEPERAAARLVKAIQDAGGRI